MNRVGSSHFLNTFLFRIVASRMATAVTREAGDAAAHGSDAPCCLVCLEDVEAAEAIWCCVRCREIVHLACIQHWVRSSMAQAVLQSAEPVAVAASRAWHCPKCRMDYANMPDKYLCFCEKHVDPEINLW